MTKICIPYLLKAENPHVLIISPPIVLKEKWLKSCLGYTISKYGQSFMVLGWSEEFRGRIGVNALWPKTTITTAAVKNWKRSRNLDVMSDSAYVIMTSDFRCTSGNFFFDDEVIGKHRLDFYNADKDTPVEKIFGSGYNH